MSWGEGWFLWGVFLVFPFCWACRHFLLHREMVLEKIGWKDPQRSWLRSFVLLGFGFVFLLIALAQPRLGYEKMEIQEEQRDIVVVLDVSRSMLVKDVPPNRMERAYWELRTLVERLQGERIALVIFAQRAYVRMPLSKEYDVFLDLMHESHPKVIQAQGSDMANALILASELFSSTPGAQSIVLVSDGEDHSQQLEKATDILVQKQISVYGLVLGTEEGGLVVQQDGTPFLDTQGEIVKSKRVDSGVQYLAKKTGGKAVVSQAGGEDWEMLYSKGILKQESQSVLSEEERIWNEVFMWPLGLACMCFLGSYGVRVMKIGVLFSLLLCGRAGYAEEVFFDAQDVDSIEDFAIHLYKKGDYVRSERLFEELIGVRDNEYDRDRARYNASLASYQQGKLEDALSYLQSMNHKTPQSKKNAVLITQEIENRRKGSTPQEEQEKQEPDSSDNSSQEDNAEQGQEQSQESKDASQAGEQEKSSSEQVDNDETAQNQSSNANEQTSSSESQDSPEINQENSPMNSLHDLEGLQEEMSETKDTEEGYPVELSLEEKEKQDAERMLEAVQEGKNRGFGSEESSTSGKKAW